MAVSELKMIQNFCQMYGKLCSSMLTLDLSSWISFQNMKQIGYQPYQMWEALLAMFNFDPYSTR